MGIFNAGTNYLVNGSFESFTGTVTNNGYGVAGTVNGWTNSDGVNFEIQDDGIYGLGATNGTYYLDTAFTITMVPRKRFQA